MRLGSGERNVLFNVEDFFISDFVSTATYAGTSYSVIRSEKRIEEKVADAGKRDAVSFKLRCKASDFTPAENADITYNSVVYRIKAVTQDSAGISYIMDLVLPPKAKA